MVKKVPKNENSTPFSTLAQYEQYELEKKKAEELKVEVKIDPKLELNVDLKLGLGSKDKDSKKDKHKHKKEEKLKCKKCKKKIQWIHWDDLLDVNNSSLTEKQVKKRLEKIEMALYLLSQEEKKIQKSN
eukprot:TRINITY_DN2799_c0_g1_i2.p1 TRINITY_DN2799_c0_g1~~TRINITY_DN2799_c0_g1_i2.p1  ORF type:complete len:129 (-),score=50.47 TRINITY_DN2799_c0_g1_i2:53-439(-)